MSAPAPISVTPLFVADLLTEGQLLVRALDPELVWLAHEHEPWRPRTGRAGTPDTCRDDGRRSR